MIMLPKNDTAWPIQSRRKSRDTGAASCPRTGAWAADANRAYCRLVRVLTLLVAALAVVTACSSDGSSTVAPPSASAAALSSSSAPPSAALSSSSAAAGGPCGVASSPPPVYDHVIWIWMENHRFDQVIGSPDAPYESQLAAACGTAPQYEEVGGPSLPNYIGATSGGIQGIHDDGSPEQHQLTVDNLFRQVRAAGKQSRSYEEAMPAACSLTPSGRYAVKHNPAAYYQGADDREACGRDNVPLGTLDDGPFASDLRNDTLPAFAFITQICATTRTTAR